MWWILALRDTVLFGAGLTLTIQQILSGHPNPEVLTVAAGFMGGPAVLHGTTIIGSGQSHSQSQDSSQLPEPQSPVQSASGQE